MKFTNEVIVNKPIKEVANYFADPKYLGAYQDNFIRKVHVSGDPGKEQAVSQMYYKQGKKEMELRETILVQQLPQRFKGHYHHSHMDNTMEVSFTAIDEHSTRFESYIHYTAFRGLIPKILSVFGKSMFKKQVQKWLENFKTFVEKQ